VPAGKRAQWMAVWNSARKAALKDGMPDKDAEAKAFREANGVAGPGSEKITKYSDDQERDDHGRWTEAASTKKDHRDAMKWHDAKAAEEEAAGHPVTADYHREAAGKHQYAVSMAGKNGPGVDPDHSKSANRSSKEANRASQYAARQDKEKSSGGEMKKTEVPDNEKQSQVGVGYENPSSRPGATCAGCVHFISPDRCEHVQGPIAAAAWCLKFIKCAEEEKTVTTTLKKFIPFAKVDNSIDPATKLPRREVWGIVTAEVPDKEDEVCDYAKSKPFYQAVIDEMSKATDGRNMFPLREMHGLSAAGKCIGFEFRDADREIFMGFKVVDDQAWKKVDEGVYTGFSQGGSLVGALAPDPVFEGCMRYTANPSEVSLVDNPCLAAAHFAYVKADGSVELRKFKRTEVAPTSTRLEKLEKEVADLRKATGTAPLTKTVDGEALAADAFAIAGDAKKVSTWRLPLRFATKQKSAAYVARAALLVKFSPRLFTDAEAKQALKAIATAADWAGVDPLAVVLEFIKVGDLLRGGLRKRVNKLAKTRDPGHRLSFVDADLGKMSIVAQRPANAQADLEKGMYEVGQLACLVQQLSYLVYAAVYEREQEQDGSLLPQDLTENVDALLDTLVAMLAEEAGELSEELNSRAHGA
jgi:hypothetical protein